jgi:hypothetical protein
MDNGTQRTKQPVNMPDLHSLPAGTRPTNATRNNGPDNLVLERAKLRELAEGWPCYRYASETPAPFPHAISNSLLHIDPKKGL